MVVDILNLVNEEALNFTNVLMVTFDYTFFEKVLKREFERRDLGMPFVFGNRFDLQSIFQDDVSL